MVSMIPEAAGACLMSAFVHAKVSALILQLGSRLLSVSLSLSLTHTSSIHQQSSDVNCMLILIELCPKMKSTLLH